MTNRNFDRYADRRNFVSFISSSLTTFNHALVYPLDFRSISRGRDVKREGMDLVWSGEKIREFEEKRRRRVTQGRCLYLVDQEIRTVTEVSLVRHTCR
jgi:hypothetical protein